MFKKILSFIISVFLSTGLVISTFAVGTCNEDEVIIIAANPMAKTQLAYISHENITKSLNTLKDKNIKDEDYMNFICKYVAYPFSTIFGSKVGAFAGALLTVSADISNQLDINTYIKYLDISSKNDNCGVVVPRQTVLDPKTQKLTTIDKEIIPQKLFQPSCCPKGQCPCQ